MIIFCTKLLDMQVCGRIIDYQKGLTARSIRTQKPQSVTNTWWYIWHWWSESDLWKLSTTHMDICKCFRLISTRISLYFINAHASTLLTCGNIPSVFPPTSATNAYDYFCELGVPPSEAYRTSKFYADDPLWDWQGCSPTSSCCIFNNPPWFCKQLSQMTN